MPIPFIAPIMPIPALPMPMPMLPIPVPMPMPMPFIIIPSPIPPSHIAPSAPSGPTHMGPSTFIPIMGMFMFPIPIFIPATFIFIPIPPHPLISTGIPTPIGMFPIGPMPIIAGTTTWFEVWPWEIGGRPLRAAPGTLSGTPPLTPTPTPPLTPPPPAVSPVRLGDLGRSVSISDVLGRTHLPFPIEDSCLTASSQLSLSHRRTFSGRHEARSCTSSCTRSSSPSASTVTQPRLNDDRARPKISSRRVPRQKFSMRVYISGGLRVGSSGSPSHMMTSVSNGCKHASNVVT
ncbi:hypothetical protein SCLCIDRAFT_474118 [Scleroderma citrinum Foug A]|uniref:Uncharacterized protein n=1 Tax=Scleroderma citrinum Foug A TaxID=1036808 RepID=A0A0C3AKQ7_9AGAM|nr:hypothetical protein SCLCIDRAFT_474118 [Scleroderma citrinum Foug A]